VDTIRTTKYDDSVLGGVTKLLARLSGLRQRCGNTTHFVLAGLSQGADVIHRALPKIPSNTHAEIDAVMLVADPFRAANQAKVHYFGSAGRFGYGILGDTKVPDWVASKTAHLCTRTDWVCHTLGYEHAKYSKADLQPVAAWAAN